MKVLNSQLINVPTMGVGAHCLIAVLACGSDDARLEDGGHGDWAVYVGIVPGAHHSRWDVDHWVAHNGAKQTLREARHFFRDLKVEDYRL